MGNRRSLGRDTKLNKSVGNELAGIRNRLELTQDQIAKKMGISQHAVSDIETADSEITLTKLVRYAEALGVSLHLKLPSKEADYILSDVLGFCGR